MRKKAKLSKKDKWIIAIAIIISISVAVTAVIYTTKVIYTSIYSFGNFLYYHKPVSYTHLDVYKRQDQIIGVLQHLKQLLNPK